MCILDCEQWFKKEAFGVFEYLDQYSVTIDRCWKYRRLWTNNCPVVWIRCGVSGLVHADEVLRFDLEIKLQSKLEDTRFEAAGVRKAGISGNGPGGVGRGRCAIGCKV